MDKYIKKGITIFGLLFPISMTILLYSTFLIAYLSPTQSALVTINEYNEAIPEFIIIPICITISLISIIITIKKI